MVELHPRFLPHSNQQQPSAEPCSASANTWADTSRCRTLQYCCLRLEACSSVLARVSPDPSVPMLACAGPDYYGGSRRSRSVSPALQPYPVVLQTSLPRFGGAASGFNSTHSMSSQADSGSDYGDNDGLSLKKKRLHSLQLGKVNVTSVRASSPFLKQRAAHYSGIVSNKIDALDTRLKRIHQEVGVPMADLRKEAANVKFF
eukprot:SAG31_NODE_226_length_19837_cov_4.368730_2_plen_202_part_00